MNKQEVIQQLHSSFNNLYKWIEEHPDEKFEKTYKEGKWTTAQHIDHLRKSSKALTKGIVIPKLMLRFKFGTCNRQERTYEKMKQKYHNKLKVVDTTEFNSQGKFAPRTLDNSQKQYAISGLRSVNDKLIEQGSKWNEKALSKYVLPHPALGKMTIRELLMFTAFHTEHHLINLKENYS